MGKCPLRPMQQRQLFDARGRVEQERYHADAEMGRREDLNWVVRFLIGHYHFGSWALQRILDIYQQYPLCLEESACEHLVVECAQLWSP